MPAITSFGIVSIGTALTEEFRLKKSVDVSTPTLTSVGGFHAATAYGEIYEFSASGKGDVPADFALGGGGPTIAGLTGGVTLIESTDEDQSNTGRNGWSASGTHAAGAAA
ncbi:MAG: hypothetical protein QM496_01935 [Verrucomicrobiota bacterium]